MTKLKRAGRRETFSVSVTPETKARLRKAADRAFGGNVSAVIEAIALEADRQGALEWLRDRAPAVSDAAFEEFMREMSGKKPRKTKPAA